MLSAGAKLAFDVLGCDRDGEIGTVAVSARWCLLSVSNLVSLMVAAHDCVIESTSELGWLTDAFMFLTYF